MKNTFQVRAFLVSLLALNVACSLRPWLRMKSQVVRGDSVVMTCKYDLDDGQKLKKIVFSFGYSEFYRYEPGASPEISIPASGININKEKSSTNIVQIDNVQLNNEGEYRCNVETTNPWDSETDKTSVTVIDLPEKDPVITGAQSKYKVGDTLNLNCTSFRSRPGGNIQWYLKGVTWPSELSYEQEKGLYTVTKTLTLKLAAYHFSGNNVNARCDVNIGYVYKKSMDLWLPKEE